MPLRFRSRILRSLAFAASAAVVVPLCGAPAASADQGQSVVGRLVQGWSESGSTSDSSGPLSWIDPGHGDAVRVPTGEVTNLPLGATVEADLGGQAVDGAPGVEPARQVLAAHVVSPAPAAPKPAAAASLAADATAPTNQVTVVMAVPSDEARNSLTLATVVAAVNGPVAKFWSDQSKGAVRIQVTAQVDWPAQPYAAPCTSPVALLDEAQAKSGFVPGPGRHLLVYIPGMSLNCGAEFAETGSGTASGGRMIVTGASANTIAHAFGHNFGLRHAGALSCDQGVEAGTCSTGAWSDLYDVMGCPCEEPMGSLSPMEAAQLGFLDPAPYTVRPGSIQELLPYGNLTNDNRFLRIVAADGNVYWLEDRQPIGQDSWLGTTRDPRLLDAGVIIRRETRPGDPDYALTSSVLLDATPSPLSFASEGGDWQAALQTGAPVHLDGGQISVSQTPGDPAVRVGLLVAGAGGDVACAAQKKAAPSSGVSLLDDGATASALVVGGDRAVWSRPVDGSAGGWQSLGGAALYGPASARAGSVSYLFAVGTDHGLWYRSRNGSAWSAWTSLGGYLTASPAAASLGSGEVRVFGRGGDGSLWSRELRTGSWSSWTGLGGSMTAPPSATADTLNGRIVVLVRGTDGYNWEQDLAPGSGPTFFQKIGMGTCSSFAMGAVRAADQPMRGVYLDGSNQPVVYVAVTSAPIGGALTSNPAVSYSSTVAAEVLVAGRGGDGALWVYDTHGGPALDGHTWQSLGGYILG